MHCTVACQSSRKGSSFDSYSSGKKTPVKKGRMHQSYRQRLNGSLHLCPRSHCSPCGTSIHLVSLSPLLQSHSVFSERPGFRLKGHLPHTISCPTGNVLFRPLSNLGIFCVSSHINLTQHKLNTRWLAAANRHRQHGRNYCFRSLLWSRLTWAGCPSH